MRAIVVFVCLCVVSAQNQNDVTPAENPEQGQGEGSVTSKRPDQIKKLCNLTEYAYTAGEEMDPPLCFVINDDVFTLLSPVVDDFTLLRLAGSYKNPLVDKSNLDQSGLNHVRLEATGLTSTYKTRSRGSQLSNRYYVPFWTAIIELRDGFVQSINWDDGCWGCDRESAACLDKTCSVPHSECFDESTRSGAVNCDVKVYVGWFGTDKNGKYLTSAGKRLSRFRSTSLQDLFNAASDIV
eukprot:CAMPEP_0175092840 /NCGR_PEP_ID=MMETSP0086_2-20121207/2678_1 /TAXON_ID=136419 /ORGANISM="Unknown Unknown, Strain D1" /LENGTH=238 /DNA_ID=CAMNT_0016365731 /DNA_START=46 /DNA_END=762 /DNA_ORIENTATION=+